MYRRRGRHGRVAGAWRAHTSGCRCMVNALPCPECADSEILMRHRGSRGLRSLGPPSAALYSTGPWIPCSFRACSSGALAPAHALVHA